MIIGLINFIDIATSRNFLYTENNKENRFLISHFNVKTENDNYTKLIKQIKNINPDIIILEEINDTWLEQINEIKSDYPYCLEHPRDDNFGIATYSKIPMSTKIEKWLDWEVPVIVTDINFNNHKIKIIGIHTLPPIKSYIDRRNLMLEKLNKIIQKNPENLIIMGDLNTTKYSYAYKKFIGTTNIKNTQNGLWISGSWPASFPPFLRIGIDHILFSKNLKIHSRYNGNSIGSDHLPIYAEISIEN